MGLVIGKIRIVLLAIVKLPRQFRYGQGKLAPASKSMIFVNSRILIELQHDAMGC